MIIIEFIAIWLKCKCPACSKAETTKWLVWREKEFTATIAKIRQIHHVTWIAEKMILKIYPRITLLWLNRISALTFVRIMWIRIVKRFVLKGNWTVKKSIENNAKINVKRISSIRRIKPEDWDKYSWLICRSDCCSIRMSKNKDKITMNRMSQG